MSKIIGRFLNIVFSNNRFQIKSKKIFGINLYLFICQHVDRKIFLNIYEKNETRFFLKEIVDSDICLDVGSNIGFFSFLFASKARKVFSIEPIRKNVKLMELTAAVNYINNLEIINALASDDSGVKVFLESEQTSLSGIKKDGFEQDLVENYGVIKTATYEVESLIIDDLIFSKLDIVKIDVEGAELRVLFGMKKTLEKHTPRVLMIEVVESALMLHGDSIKDLVFFMRELNYDPMILSSNELVPYEGNMIPNDNLFFKYSN